MALATVDDLRFSYGSGPPVLDGITLRIEPGERIVLLGASAAGKSTLLRALAGLVPHFHGGTFAGQRRRRRARHAPVRIPAQLAGHGGVGLPGSRRTRS